MAITGLRLDGQTIGIQITAPSNSASIFSLDTLTGVITSGIDSAGSPFLTDSDIRALKPGVDALFTLVPAAARTGMAAADALALLVKLCTVSPAADDAVTLSAVSGGGDVWALQAAATAPAYLVAHLPFSADGSVAWATGIAAGGGAYFRSASVLASQLQAASAGYVDLPVAGMNSNSVIIGVKAVVSQNSFTNSVGTLLALDYNLYDSPQFPAGGRYIVSGSLYAVAGTIANGTFGQGVASYGLASGWNAPFFRITGYSLGSLNPNNALLTLSLLCMDV